MSDDPRIDILIETLKENKNIPEADRGELADELTFAEKISENPDPLYQMNKRMLIIGVRREIRTHERHVAMKRDLADVVTNALNDHTKNCLLALMKAKAEEAAKMRAMAETASATGTGTGNGGEGEHDESSISIKKLGIEAKGGAATVISAVVAVAVVVVAWVSWQQGKTRDIIKESMNSAVQEAVQEALAGK